MFQRTTIGKSRIAALLVLLVCMAVNCWHTHLWGPDEPREAEIAREILQDGSWVVPHFRGLPFVEKPPLYYDVSALIHSLCPHPGALRLHSALLGIAMLAALYIFAAKKCGRFIAFGACALCVSMPQFYRAAHWILLDIGVGAWVTAGLVCYGFWSLRGKEENSTAAAILFFFFAALGMLTKGVITLVYLGSVIVPHWYFFRRKKMPPFWTALFFLLPVSLWIVLFYREGGICFLHEHFVNNTVGRLLHRKFVLEGMPEIITDVGHNSPLLFYLIRLPNMFGAVLALLPVAVAWAWRTAGWKFFRWRLPEKLQRIWDLLTAPRAEVAERQKELLCFLMLWSFVPFFVFSVPAIKEVTYLLPSYAGFALLAACCLADRLALTDETALSWLRSFALPLLGFSAVLSLPAAEGAALQMICAGLIWSWLAFEVIRAMLRREYRTAVLPLIAALIVGVMLCNFPGVMVRSRLARKCYCRLAVKVWEEAGDCQMYLTSKEESIGGALAFYGKRNVRILSRNVSPCEFLANPGKRAFLFHQSLYEKQLKNPRFAELLSKYRIVFPGFPEKVETFVLLVPKEAD